jgi:hypothetical protein
MQAFVNVAGSPRADLKRRLPALRVEPDVAILARRAISGNLSSGRARADPVGAIRPPARRRRTVSRPLGASSGQPFHKDFPLEPVSPIVNLCSNFLPNEGHWNDRFRPSASDGCGISIAGIVSTTAALPLAAYAQHVGAPKGPISWHSH